MSGGLIKFLDAAEGWSVAVLLLVCVALAWWADHYMLQARLLKQQLHALQEDVARQNLEAERKLCLEGVVELRARYDFDSTAWRAE